MRRVRLVCIFAGLAAALSLGGCLLGPNYSREPVATPATYRFAAAEAADTANTEWWRQFGDPVLDELISTALANNKDVKIAQARVEQFLGQFVTTRSSLFPQVSAGATASRQRAPLPSLQGLPGNISPVYNDFELSVSTAWELDLFGRNRRLTEAARANLASSEEGRRATILSLVASVASSYLSLRSLDRQLDIAKATTQSRAESVHVFTLRFEGGEVSQMELAQSQSEYEASLATIPQLETAIAQQEDALSVLLGANPGPIVRGRELGSLATPVIPAGLPSDLLERRPDLLQAEQDLVAANALIGAARALYFPQISLTGLLGTASGQFSSLFTGPSRVWSFAGQVTQPIFTAGNIAGQVQTAEAQQQAALFTYQKAIQVAFQEVDDALISSEKLHQQLEIQGRQVTALATYAHLARARYEGGYTSYIEVLDAERSLFNAQLSQTQTQAAALTSFVTLYKVMGGGWVVAADKMTTQTAGTNVPPAPSTPSTPRAPAADAPQPGQPAAPTLQ